MSYLRLFFVISLASVVVASLTADSQARSPETSAVGRIQSKMKQGRDGKHWLVRERNVGYLRFKQSQSDPSDESGRMKWSCAELESEAYHVSLAICENQVTIATVCNQKKVQASLAADLNFKFQSIFSMQDIASGDTVVILQNAEYKRSRFSQILVVDTSLEENARFLYGKAFWIQSRFLCNHRSVGLN